MFKNHPILGVCAFSCLLFFGCATVETPQHVELKPVQQNGSARIELTPFVAPVPEKTTLVKVLPSGACAGTSVCLAGIEIVPISDPAAPQDTQYLTLDEAIASGVCVVREIEGGDVNMLLASNNGGRPVFLMAGDLVLGGKQDRILANGVVLEPGAKDQSVSVFCVEHGRWTTVSGDAKSAKGEFDNNALNGQVDIAVKRAAVGEKNQSSVWAAVAHNNRRLGVNASGGSFRATFDSEETRKKLDDLMQKAAAARTGSEIGFAVIADGEVAAMDLFDSSGLCTKLSEKLLRSYLITAMSGGYEPAMPHPLAALLHDKATIEIVDMPLKQALAAINAKWAGKLKLGDMAYNPTITFRAENLDMAQVLEALCCFFGLSPRVDLDTTVRLNTLAYLDDIQFGNNACPGGTGNDAGIFFQDIAPSGNVRIDQRARAQFSGARIPVLSDLPLIGQLFRRSTRPATFTTSLGVGAPVAIQGPRLEAVDPKPVEYECKDGKRDSVVHRGYIRR